MLGVGLEGHHNNEKRTEADILRSVDTLTYGKFRMNSDREINGMMLTGGYYMRVRGVSI